MTDLPRSSAEITPAWLNSALSSEVRGGATVVEVEPEVIGAGVGFIGEVARLQLTYDDPSPSSTPTVISKLPTVDPGFRQLGTLLGLYEKEHCVYRDIGKEIPCRIPDALVNQRRDDDFILILEDLAELRAGDQLAGCSMTEARSAMEAIALVHARWWEDPALAEFGSWLPDIHHPYFELLGQTFVAALPAFHEKFSHLVSDTVGAFADRMGSEFRRAHQAGIGRGPHTLVHGDFRLDNMLFDDSGAVTLIDWQLPFKANPGFDLAYFLAGNFAPEVRRAEERDLIAHYHEVLVDNGVTGYPLERCIDDYRACGIVLMGYLVTGAQSVDLENQTDRGRELIETMYSRYAIAVDDLGSIGYFDACD